MFRLVLDSRLSPEQLTCYYHCQNTRGKKYNGYEQYCSVDRDTKWVSLSIILATVDEAKTSPHVNCQTHILTFMPSSTPLSGGDYCSQHALLCVCVLCLLCALVFMCLCALFVLLCALSVVCLVLNVLVRRVPCLCFVFVFLCHPCQVHMFSHYGTSFS